MLDYLGANPWLIWLLVGVFFLILEAATQALVSIWFVPSALIASVVSLLTDSAIIQTAVFVVLSALFLFLFKALYSKFWKKKRDTVKEENSLIGRSATAASEITAYDGKALVGDVYWHAVCQTGTVASGEKVVITAVRGTTLTVEKTNK